MSKLRRLLTALVAVAMVPAAAPAPITRLRGEFRRHLQLNAPSGDPLRAALRAGWQPIKPPEGVRSIVDIDPVDML